MGPADHTSLSLTEAGIETQGILAAMTEPEETKGKGLLT